MRRNVPGTIYLLHFDKPFGHARHYLGWTEGPVEQRLAAHAGGNGSKLMHHVTAAGIGFQLVRTWQGDRYLERRLKGSHSPRLCPVCNPPREPQPGRDARGRFIKGHVQCRPQLSVEPGSARRFRIGVLLRRFFVIVGEAHARADAYPFDQRRTT